MQISESRHSSVPRAPLYLFYLLALNPSHHPYHCVLMYCSRCGFLVSAYAFSVHGIFAPAGCDDEGVACKTSYDQKKVAIRHCNSIRPDSQKEFFGRKKKIVFFTSPYLPSCSSVMLRLLLLLPVPSALLGR